MRANVRCVRLRPKRLRAHEQVCAHRIYAECIAGADWCWWISERHSALCQASCRHIGSDAPIVLKELSGVRKRPMIIPMPTPARPQQRYDHRLRGLVQRTGDVTNFEESGDPHFHELEPTR